MMTEADWRMKAMADFFGAKFVRVDEDGEPMTTNDATPRESVTIADLLNALGPGATVTYIGQEGPRWWVELRLPESRYLATLATDSGSTPDEALQSAVAHALTFAKEGQE